MAPDAIVIDCTAMSPTEVVAAMMQVVGGRRLFYAIVRGLLRVCFHLFCGFKVTGLENADGRCNHSGCQSCQRS